MTLSPDWTPTPYCTVRRLYGGSRCWIEDLEPEGSSGKQTTLLNSRSQGPHYLFLLPWSKDRADSALGGSNCPHASFFTFLPQSIRSLCHGGLLHLNHWFLQLLLEWLDLSQESPVSHRQTAAAISPSTLTTYLSNSLTSTTTPVLLHRLGSFPKTCIEI